MASVLINTELSKNGISPLAARGRGQSQADVPLFRYGLRQMLLFVAAICALLAAIASADGLAASALLLAAAVVAMHVFATALGSRLQTRTERERQAAIVAPIDGTSNSSALDQSAKLAAICSAPRSPWHGRGSTYLPWLPRLVVGAMLVGGLAGSLLLSSVLGNRVSLAGIVVGAVSFAVLGGWFSFLCGNFYGVFRHGVREAIAEERRDQARQAVGR